MKLTTPILLLVFNRPTQTKKVFEEIRRAKPSRLYIAANCPRTDKLGEMERCKEVKKIVSKVDWKCETHYLERKSYLECGKSISSAINWFFKNVKDGMILEDDCLPNQDFFRFCQEMLKKYNNNNKIMHISGDNFISNRFSMDSYYFTKYPLIWGWATWRSAWENYDFEAYKKITLDKIEEKIPNILERKIFIKRLKEFKLHGSESWDIQWCWEIRNKNGLCICPKVNLVENLGLSGGDATHTHENFWDKFFLNRKRENLRFPLRHPLNVKRNGYKDFKMVTKDLLRAILKKLF